MVAPALQVIAGTDIILFCMLSALRSFRSPRDPRFQKPPLRSRKTPLQALSRCSFTGSDLVGRGSRTMPHRHQSPVIIPVPKMCCATTQAEPVCLPRVRKLVPRSGKGSASVLAQYILEIEPLCALIVRVIVREPRPTRSALHLVPQPIHFAQSER
jgi:hypothetical protein